MMTRIFWDVVLIVCITVAIFDAIGWFRRRRLPKFEDAYIKEQRIKIMLNPFDNDKMYWVLLNPKNHIWEWKKEATTEDVLIWNDARTEKEKVEGVPYYGGFLDEIPVTIYHYTMGEENHEIPDSDNQ